MVAVLGGSRWKAIYHVPLLLALSLEEQAGTCVHELPTYPAHPPAPWRRDTEEREREGERERKREGKRKRENIGLLE